MLIRKLDLKTNIETDLFEGAADSSFSVQRCDNCDKIHLLLFKHNGDKVATICIDITDTFAALLVAELVQLLGGTMVANPGTTIN